MAESLVQSVHPQQTFEQLYTDHHSWLYRWLCKKVNCSHQAADFMQDTFCRLLKLDVSQIQEPRAFLTTTATRIVINDARRRQVERSYLDAIREFDNGELVEPATPTLEQHLVIVETLTAIVEMLEGLSGKCQQAFLLFRLDGMKQADIAQAMNISVSMVKKYIAQAMMHCYHIMHQTP